MEDNWTLMWNEDIDYLRDNLTSKHKNLFFSISKEEFECKINNLKSMLGTLDYNEMKVELSRIVASVRDAHTAIAFPINKYLPLKFYCFSDGIYIIGVVKGYEDLLYKKVDKIEDTDINQVMNELSKIISHENKYFLKGHSAKYLQAAEVLYGLLICDDVDKINITVEGKQVEVLTVMASELRYIEDDNIPLYAERESENYWSKFLEDDGVMYIKYNSCREEGNISIKEKIEDTIRGIEEKNISKVTIDLRNNLGGNSDLINPLIDFIKTSETINRKENLNIIIGRETFSSALLNAYRFKWETNAVIVGEPSGGKPNCYGEILRFTLPNSKFVVSYSTRFYKLIEDDSIMALYPDETIEESIHDYKLI
ncbi:MAG: peptidase S41 [Clostridium sp.]|uniref:peptidase S41 n=1 Tax=Clostridium sp. TaxID=1506 RepID=UPI0030336BF4